MEDIITTEKKYSVLNKIINFLKIKFPELTDVDVKENIKELCVAKLCEVIGVRCKYNYKSEFFNFFSDVVGEALCRKLTISIQIADDKYRLFKYDGVNLIDRALNILNSFEIDEAFLEIFEFLDKFKYVIKVK